MRKTRILVVDDNVAYCDELKRELAATELFEVSAVYDGLSAIKACESFRPDAMVLDMMMPTIDGLDVLHTLSESGLKVHTIAVSLPIGDGVCEPCSFLGRALLYDKASQRQGVSGKVDRYRHPVRGGLCPGYPLCASTA